jgi:hypothetical protein
MQNVEDQLLVIVAGMSLQEMTARCKVHPSMDYRPCVACCALLKTFVLPFALDPSPCN